MSKVVKLKKKIKRNSSSMARLHVTVPEAMKHDLKAAVDYWNSSMSKEFRSFASKLIAETEKVKVNKRGGNLVRESIIKQRIGELTEDKRE